MIVGEDLVDAEDDVGEEEGAFDGVAFAAADAPGAEEDGAGDGYADEGCVDVADLGEVGYAPEEVDRAGDDGGGHD